jgi:hypothetical protein
MTPVPFILVFILVHHRFPEPLYRANFPFEVCGSFQEAKDKEQNQEVYHGKTKYGVRA